MTAALPPVVSARRLRKRFASNLALADFTVDVPAGAVFALVGPNGAGKTTALKTMLNVVRRDGGTATVMGVDSTRVGVPEFQRIAYVSEEQKLPDWMTVGYFLRYLRPFYPAWTDDEASALVAAYELPLDRPLKALSRGMRMKAALASSLAYRPKLIILDEPFGGLDVVVRDQLIGTILERVPESTVIISSHDLGEIETFATHLAYVEGGRVRFSEEITTLSDRFREIEVTLEDDAELPAEWPERWWRPERTPAMLRFFESGFSEGATQREVTERIRGVRQVEVRRMPLRSIFLETARHGKEHAQ